MVLPSEVFFSLLNQGSDLELLDALGPSSPLRSIINGEDNIVSDPQFSDLNGISENVDPTLSPTSSKRLEGITKCVVGFPVRHVHNSTNSTIRLDHIPPAKLQSIPIIMADDQCPKESETRGEREHQRETNMWPLS